MFTKQEERQLTSDQRLQVGFRRLDKRHRERLWKSFLSQREMYRRSFLTAWKFRHLKSSDGKWATRGRLPDLLVKLKEFRDFNKWCESRT